MKKWIIAMIAVLVVIMLLLVGVMIFVINQGGVPMLFSGGDLPLVNTQTRSLDEIDDISISYISESIRIYESDTDEIVIKEYMNREDEDLFAKISQQGGTLRIQNGRRNFMSFNFRAKVEIYLPTSYHGALAVGSTSGSIKLEPSYQLKSIGLSSVSGSIKAQELEAETITLSSTSGSIQVQKADGLISASSVSGSIRIEDGARGGTFSTTSGSIRVTLSQVDSDVSLSSVSGSLRLYIPEDSSFKLSAHSVSGSIHTGFDGDLVYEKSHSASGTVGSNPAFSVEMNTTSGSIRINND